MRHRLKDSSSPAVLSPQAMVDEVIVITKKSQALQIVDTTLLKCYLQTNDALVAPLLRLRDNCCHPQEAERVLKKSQKFTELVIFYNTSGLHRKALELLRLHSTDPDSPLSGHSRTLTYLQNLGPDHVDLILEFSLWVIMTSPEDGLTIFTEDMDTVESLPRGKVLDWLLRNARELVIPYLEHLILVWSEESPLFHNSLVLQYKDVILESNHTDTITKRKLRQLLEQEPSYYHCDQVLPKFPSDCLFEERAILLGRGGRHRDALIIYINILGDINMAKQYCAREKCAGRSEVYQHLVELLVSPVEPSQLPAGAKLFPQLQLPDMETAVSVLEHHWRDVEISRVVAALPSSASLHALSPSITAAIQSQLAARHQTQLVRALTHCSHLQLQQARVSTESARLDITERSVCVGCGKRFGSLSAFARRPDGQLLHYSCAMD